MTSVLTHLGKITVGRFMREYWQRKPLLVRGAFRSWAAAAPPVDRSRIFELAGQEDVESRLISHRGKKNWSLRNGPFARRALPRLSQKNWTLLVQGVDLVDAGARGLLSRFRFVPDARLDDLMASFATEGGGVGPHVDNYDVFLLQARGRRRWQISRQRDLGLQPGKPLRLLANFHSTEEWLLEPGDLLYLPPGVAHHGVAEGECISYSVGFRAPSYQELHDPWLAGFAERTRIAGRYTDPDQRATLHPAALPRAMVSRVHARLTLPRPTRADTERFLLGYLSEPKPQVVFDRPRRAPSFPAFERAVRRSGVVLDIRSRMLSASAVVALNGELIDADRKLLPALRLLADWRALGAGSLARAPRQLLVLLHEWRVAGWLHVASTRLYGRSPDLP